MLIFEVICQEVKEIGIPVLYVPNEDPSKDSKGFLNYSIENRVTSI